MLSPQQRAWDGEAAATSFSPEDEDENVAPWHRQPTETALAYQRFALYRDLGPEDRSLRVVAEKVGTTHRTIERSSRANRWAERVRKYDLHMDRVREKAMEKEKVKMAGRQARLGVIMQEKALATIKTMPVTSIPEATSLAKEGVKIERLARGERTSDAGGGGIHLVWSGPMPPWFGHNQGQPNTTTPGQMVVTQPKLLEGVEIEGPKEEEEEEEGEE